MSLHLHLFGSPRVAQHNGAVALAFERRSQLLAHLALRRGPAPRSELAAMLWPDVPQEQAHTNLRKTLFRLRGLPYAPAIVSQEQSLAFDGTTDVADFEVAIAQRRWADALDIAGDPLLGGFDDDSSELWTQWLRAERERLRSAWYEAAAHCLAEADPADALALSARLLAHDPLNETALRAQMVAYAQLGRPTRAREAYRRYAALLAETVGCTPSTELQAVHDALGTGAANAMPAAPIPTALPRIIGRAVEQRAIRARLEAGHRLLSLVGPGGVGKSCLARHLCTELAPHYADGAVYVPLDDVPSPDALGARLARELGVASGCADPLQAVTAFLRGRRMLLVLDNFEHVQASAPQLQMLLDACHRVQMLVTSRTRLGLGAEQMLPLQGLPCPEPEDADCVGAFDAPRLFVSAAQTVGQALSLATDAAAIAEICRLVDGLPLALEIAGGWTRMLPCQTIAAELRRDIGLLTQADAARPARHASMAAVFEQSWQRLCPTQRDTWARLTVLHGGFTLDAARAVVGATLPELAVLTDHSLLRKTGPRFDLHPLLRQLAATRLTADQHQASRTAHAAHYLHWLAQRRDSLQDGDRETLQQADVELENVRAAWRWASANGPASALKAAAVSLLAYCNARGHIAEALALQREAAAGVGADDPLLGPLLDAMTAYFEWRQGRYAEAQALAERALLAAKATQDYDTRRLCLRVLGGSAKALGSMPMARHYQRRGLAAALRAGDVHAAAGFAQDLAMVEMECGRYDAARALLVRALAAYKRGTPYHEACCLNNLATLELETGQLDAAVAHVQAGLALCEGDAFHWVKTALMLTATELAVQLNDAAAAQRHGQAAIELVRRMGARDMQAWLQLRLGQADLLQGDVAAARESLRRAAEDAIDLPDPVQLDCVGCLAQLLYAQDEPVAAIRLLRYAIDHPATEIAVRNRAKERLVEWLTCYPDMAALPAFTIDLTTLMHRIVAETPTAHAALIASLRGPVRPSSLEVDVRVTSSGASRPLPGR